MTLPSRLGLALLLLGIGVAAHLALRGHLAVEEVRYPILRKRLTSFPERLLTPVSGDPKKELSWTGKELELPENFFIRKDLQIDQAIFRAYGASPGSVLVYLGHSQVGDDRKHHPVVCMGVVQGLPEDESARRLVFLDPEKKKRAVRFVFGASRPTIAYYWHYTFPPVARDGLSWFQEAHYKWSQLSQSAPSLTVQVYTNLPENQQRLVETSLLVFLDDLLQREFLPAGCTMGSHWLNIDVKRN